MSTLCSLGSTPCQLIFKIFSASNYSDFEMSNTGDEVMDVVKILHPGPNQNQWPKNLIEKPFNLKNL